MRQTPTAATATPETTAAASQSSAAPGAQTRAQAAASCATAPNAGVPVVDASALGVSAAGAGVSAAGIGVSAGPMPELGACCHGGEEPVEPGVQEDREVWAKTWLRVAIAIVFGGQGMVLGLGLNRADPKLEPDNPVYWVLHGGLFLSALVAFALLGWPLVKNAWLALREGRISVESLFLLSAIGALAASILSTLMGYGAVYYEIVAIVLAIYTVGKLLGARSRARALAAAKALSDEFEYAYVDTCCGSRRKMAVADLALSMPILVGPGEPIAVDGVIGRGEGFVVETAMTGETAPVLKRPGDSVWAGSYSVEGTFSIENRAVKGERRIDAVLDTIVKAQLRPSRLQRRSDTLMMWFVPFVATVSVGTFIVWSFLAPWQQALFNSMAVLLVACPCALGLATPIAVWSALIKLSRAGLVARTGDFCDTLALSKRIVFDKTGTISTEQLQVHSCRWLEPEQSELWMRLVRTAEQANTHPVARALATLGLAETLTTAPTAHSQTQATTPSSQTQAASSVSQTEVLTPVSQTEASMAPSQVKAATPVSQAEVLTASSQTKAASARATQTEAFAIVPGQVPGQAAVSLAAQAQAQVHGFSTARTANAPSSASSSEDRATAQFAVRAVETVAGKGIIATLAENFTGDSGNDAVGGERVYSVAIGQPQLFDAVQREALEAVGALHTPAEAKRQVWVCVDGRPVGIIFLSEALRANVAESLAGLRADGVAVEILTGDPEPLWEQIGGVKVHAGLSPLEKEALVRQWSQAGEQVLFVGDGVNDASAMTTAAASIAMSTGAELTRASSTAVLVAPTLEPILRGRRICQAMRRTLRGNMYFALVYNLIGISLAAFGVLNPVVAALLMLVSSAMVSYRAAYSASKL